MTQTVNLPREFVEYLLNHFLELPMGKVEGIVLELRKGLLDADKVNETSVQSTE